MNDFSTIYKILSALRDSMDYEQFDMRLVSAGRLGITEPRRSSLLCMLVASGYIEGVSFDEAADGSLMISTTRPRITLKGLEYLEENSLMRRAYRMAKGITDIIP